MSICCLARLFRRHKVRTGIDEDQSGEEALMISELNWIDGPWPGRLAVSPRPRGGDWIEGEVSSWQKAGIDLVVSLLSGDEIADLDLTKEEQACNAQNMEFLLYSLPDRGVPLSRESFSIFVCKLADKLWARKNVLVHCRQGLGRAGLVAISLLISAGVEPENAIQRVSSARGCPVPETPEQNRWLLEFAEWSADHASR